MPGFGQRSSLQAGIVPADQALPAELVTSETEGFAGDLTICRHGECLEGQKYHVMGGLFVGGRSTVSAYDPQAGIFASHTVVTHGVPEDITLEVDLQWTPPDP